MMIMIMDNEFDDVDVSVYILIYSIFSQQFLIIIYVQ